VLFDTSREIAATVGERVQHSFEEAASDVDGRMVSATVSTGVAFSGHGSFELPALLLRADQALYQAKQDGRNRVAITMSDVRVAADDDAGHIVTLRRRDAA
jgi:diguanylate cyclase (GGDEF)-like protein